MKTKALVLAVVIGFCFAGLAAETRAESGDMKLRFGLSLSTPTDDLSDGGQTTELDDSLGFRVSFEYMATDLIGIEPTLRSVNFDVEVEQTGPDASGEIDLFELSANLNFHLLRDRDFDLHVGPTIGYSFWGDLDTDAFPPSFPTQSAPTDDEFLYGVHAGVDVPFGDGKWSFTGGFDYVLTEVGLESGGGDLGVDPFHLQVGVAYGF